MLVNASAHIQPVSVLASLPLRSQILTHVHLLTVLQMRRRVQRLPLSVPIRPIRLIYCVCKVFFSSRVDPTHFKPCQLSTRPRPVCPFEHVWLQLELRRLLLLISGTSWDHLSAQLLINLQVQIGLIWHGFLRKEQFVKDAVQRFRIAKKVVVLVTRARRVNPNKVAFARILHQCVSEQISRATIQTAYLFQDGLPALFTQKILEIDPRTTQKGPSPFCYRFPIFVNICLICLVCGPNCRIGHILARLVEFGVLGLLNETDRGHVFEAIFTLANIFTPSIKPAQTNQIHGLQEELRLNFEVKGGLGGE